MSDVNYDNNTDPSVLESSATTPLLMAATRGTVESRRSPASTTPNGRGDIEWGKFGLNDDKNMMRDRNGQEDIKELFQLEAENADNRPWWKTNFFVREPVLFGTWDGVFTSTMLNIVGVIVFLRTGWMVGNAGIGLAFVIIMLSVFVGVVSAVSAIGVCERLHIGSGGIYFLLSQVLGARIGATIGLVYVFAQAVGCALYLTGLGESVAEMAAWESPWAVRGVATVMLVLLLAINIAGVKWVIKLQLLLLGILAVSILDFVVGTFVHTDPDSGFYGYRSELFRANFEPSYMAGQSFFTVFGVFFPTATGIMAGINMSGDLRNPSKNIPEGTLMSLIMVTFVYAIHVLLLGWVCTRDVLQTDFLIAEKVAVVGYLWLCGLYISSLSSCLGGLYGAPRILQRIANEKAVPIIACFGRGRGANDEPMIATLFVGFIALLFILIGQVNILGPIVTLPFLLTYCYVDYAYFVLAMSYDRLLQTKQLLLEGTKLLGGGGSIVRSASGQSYGTSVGEGQDYIKGQAGEVDPIKGTVYKFNDDGDGETPDNTSTKDCSDSVNSQGHRPPPYQVEIYNLSDSWYTKLCNRWVSLAGAFFSLLLMFFIHWDYTLILLLFVLVIYIYIGQANPGIFPGISDFNFFKWVQTGLLNCCRGPEQPGQMVVTRTNLPTLTTSQITEENEDYQSRQKFHQSSVVKGQNFDDLEEDADE